MNMGLRGSVKRPEEELIGLLRSGRVIPVLTIERAEDAVPLARALVAGGGRVLEITLRTDAAVDAAQALLAARPEAIAGPGPRLTPQHPPPARALGARFPGSPPPPPQF